MRWSDLEMSSLKTGDKRLDRRVKHTIARMATASNSSFPACFKTRAELVGAYRLFNNEFVDPEKILVPHYKSVAQRAKAHSVVLLLNDTSSLDYTSRDIEGLGMLEKTYTQGFFIHPTLAVTPDRHCLGLVDNEIWVRPKNQQREKLSGSIRGNQPIEEKESYRWLRSYQQAALFAASVPITRFVFVADRESDILELLTKSIRKEQAHNIDILIRAKHDRVLLGETDERNLRKTLTKAPMIAQIQFQISERAGQKSREVRQVVRVKEVTLQGKTVNGKVYSAVTINAVLCIEEKPSSGVDPVVWLLLTTLPVSNEEEVFKVIQYYLCRWEIETFFHVLKNGCKVEERELQTMERLKTMLALFMVVAWRVMYLMNLGRQEGSRLCSEVFEDAEWISVCNILNKEIPRGPPSLGEFMVMVGKLGGYQPRKSPPGVKVIWEGLKRMADYALMWEMINAKPLSTKSCV